MLLIVYLSECVFRVWQDSHKSTQGWKVRFWRSVRGKFSVNNKMKHFLGNILQNTFYACFYILREKFFINALHATALHAREVFHKWNYWKNSQKFHQPKIGNVDLSGVSRVWQAWHMPWAPLWRGRKNCLAKLKSLFTVSLTSNLSPMHS